MNHFYKEIPGWFGFRSLYLHVLDQATNGMWFVEVGSWKGRSASFMAVELENRQLQIQFDCVDTWNGTPGEHDADISVQRGSLYEDFLRNIAPVSHRINVIRKPSIEAASEYEDCSLDFVFIDADHSFDAVTEDLNAWWRKLKSGGLIAGDDFGRKTVSSAVLTFCGGEYSDLLYPEFVPERKSRQWWLVKQ